MSLKNLVESISDRTFYRNKRFKRDSNENINSNKNQTININKKKLDDLNENIFNDLNKEECELNEYKLDDLNKEDKLSTNYFEFDKQIDDRKTAIEIINSIQLDHSLPNNAIDRILKLCNFTTTNNIYLPNSIYLLQKECDLDLEINYGFKCTNCDQELFLKKLNNQNFKCIYCDKLITVNNVLQLKNHYFLFNLREILELLINNFELLDFKFSDTDKIESFTDAKIFKDFYFNLNSKLILITSSLDGVPLSKNIKNKSQIWPLYIKIHHLDIKSPYKTFLIGCTYTYGKPNLNLILNQFVNQLNELYDNGIMINKTNQLVYPILFNFVLDLPARHSVLNHRYFNTYFSCTQCLIKGKKIRTSYKNRLIKKKRSKIIFPIKKSKRRSIEFHNICFKLIKKRNLSHFYGIINKSAISKLKYFNYILCCNIEPMHFLIIGVCKKMLLSIKDYNYRKRICYLNKLKSKLIDKRIDKININSKFKRELSKFTNINNWKANQIFEFIVYLSPILFSSLLSDQCFKHLMIFVYILSKSWSSFSNNDLNKIKILVKLFLKDYEHIYHIKDLSMNLHLINHIPSTIKNLGPLGDALSAFEFESKNHQSAKMVNNFRGVLEQIIDKTKRIMFSILNYKNDLNILFKVCGQPYLYDNKESYKKIIINDEEFTSFNNCNNRLCDYYIKTIDNKFIMINYYYKENNEIYFNGNEILNYGPLEIDINDNDIRTIRFDYILEAKLTEIKIDENVNKICEKVLFVPKFIDNSAQIDTNLGYVIRFIHKIHN